MQDTEVRGTPDIARPASKKARFSGDRVLWLILVCGLFTLAELTPALLRLPLGADEISYIAQTSAHASQVMLPPVHGRAVGLLAAPVTLLTTSLVVLRVWMALLSGLGLFLAMLTWRGLRPAWVLALAGFVLGSLSITQLSGVQVYPDWWSALGALAVTGLFLQAVTGRMSDRVVLPLLAAVAFFIVLLRVQNIVFLLPPVIGAVHVVPAWRKPKVLAAIAAGIAAGTAEAIGEAYIWYGGPAMRLHLAAQEPPKLGLHFSLAYQLRVLNGPWYCEPGNCHGWDFPWLTVWWLALLALIILGVFLTWRTARASSAFAVVSGLWAAACFVLFVPIAAPRYLLPAFALLAIPAADAIASLAAMARWRAAGVLLASAFLLGGVVSHNFVLRAEIKDLNAGRAIYVTKASQLRFVGIHPPCIVESPSVAYYAGCGAPWTGEEVRQVLARTPGGVSAWRKVHLRNAIRLQLLHPPVLPYVAWIPKHRRALPFADDRQIDGSR